jgi:WD40 repeat protein
LTFAAPVAVTLPLRPYPGLRSFNPEEWSIFFGREEMIDQVIERLAANRLVLIHGLSGSGKSSLACAGVLPKLALQYRRHDLPWLTCAMRPSGGPLWNLAAELAKLEGRAGDVELIGAIAGQFNARSATLTSVAASIESIKGKSLCVLVDQFEELFRFEKEIGRDEAELFVELVKRAATEGEDEVAPGAIDLHVIVTMRSEFLGECARFAGFAEAINRTQYLVPRMEGDALMRAVRRPAQMYGGIFDEDLAERLVASVRGREDELPLLQHGLMQMWEDATKRAVPGGPVTLDGGVVDGAGGLANLLSDHADAVMARAATEERRKRIVEAVFRALTDFDPDGAALRRPCTFHELCAIAGAGPDELRPILDAFRAPAVSFLTPYAPAPIEEKTLIDVSHEALIRCWHKIGPGEDGWLRKEFHDGVNWRTLLFQVETFANDKSSFLSKTLTEYGEGKLSEHNEAWAKRYGGGWPKVAALIQASREHWDLEGARDKEKSQAQIRLAWGVALVVSIALVTVLVLAGYTARLTRQSRNNETHALAALSHAEAREGRALDGVQLALAAWPRRASWFERPMLEESIKSLALSFSLHPPAAMIGEDDAIYGVLFNKDGGRVLSGSHDNTMRLWDTETGRGIGAPMKLDAPARGAMFIDDERLVFWSADYTLRIWDVSTGAPIGKPMGHERDVNGALLSPDGRHILSWSDDKTLRLWDASTGVLIGEPMEHDFSVNGALLSPDGVRILSWSLDTLRLWDASTGRLIGTPMRHGRKVNGALLSQDGARILSWSDDATLRLWEASTGAPIGAPMRHGQKVNGALLSQDGARILSWSNDQTLQLWDASMGAPIGNPMRHKDWVNGALFLPDDRRILSWSDDETLRLWDASTGAPIGEPMKHEGPVNDALLSPDGRRILSWSDDRTLRLWEATTGEAIGEPMRLENSIQIARFGKNARRLISYSQDKRLYVWDVATGEQVGEAMRHGQKVNGALLSPDGRHILSWSDDKTLRLWDASRGAPINEPMEHEGSVRGALLSPDGVRILSWSLDTLRLWDASTGASIGEPMKHEGSVRGALLSPDERRIVSWSLNTLRQWDASTTEPISMPMKHNDFVRGALLSSDGRRILSWADDKTLRLWDASSGAPISEPMEHEGSVRGALLSPDGVRILSWSLDTLHLWDASTGTPIAQMKHEGWVRGALLSADGRRIVSWSGDKTLRLWDASTGAPIGELMKHKDWVKGAVLAPDGRRILSWSVDNTMRLWDAATGASIGAPMRHQRLVKDALFSRDGRRIVSWSDDKTLRLWDTSTTEPIGAPMRYAREVNGALFTAEGSRVLSWSDDGTLRLWEIAWRGDDLFEIACNHTPPVRLKDMDRLSARYGIRIGEPICEPGVRVPDPDWSQMEWLKDE